MIVKKEDIMSWEGECIIIIIIIFEYILFTRVASRGTLLLSIKQKRESLVAIIQHNTNNLQGHSYEVVLFYVTSLL